MARRYRQRQRPNEQLLELTLRPACARWTTSTVPGVGAAGTAPAQGGTMTRLALTDALFLLIEGRQQPMHVASLQVYEKPKDAGRTFVRDLYESFIAVDEVAPLLSRRVRRGFGGVGPLEWVHDDDVDLEYHVRHSALPSPGRVRELLALVSRLHGSILDRRRPLWEVHVIEGLRSNRFALYMKMHHAFVDGVSGTQLVIDSLSTDPENRNMRPLWESSAFPERQSSPSQGFSPTLLARSLAKMPGSLAGAGRAVVDASRAALDHPLTGAAPFAAPRTVLNTGITGARRFAADDYSLSRVKAIGKATGTSLNDVVLAMCSGALRRYLIDHNALPDRPLIAMVPVSLRPKGEAVEFGKNAVGSILCSLATHLEDPLERLQTINGSMNETKARLAALNASQITLYSAAMTGGVMTAPLQIRTAIPPVYNLVISNVPGPRTPLYLNGAKLQGLYPVSIVQDSQALNITVLSYVDQLAFGLIGCRTALPHLQRLLDHLTTELDDLDKLSLG